MVFLNERFLELNKKVWYLETGSNLLRDLEKEFLGVTLALVRCAKWRWHGKHRLE